MGSKSSLEVEALSKTILLVTDRDNTHRKPLLESEGYQVEVSPIEDFRERLGSIDVGLILMSTDSGIEATLACCGAMKKIAPETRIAVIAQRAEYVPPDPAVDAIIRQQHSPRQFLAAIRRLLDPSPLGRSQSAGDDA